MPLLRAHHRASEDRDAFKADIENRIIYLRELVGKGEVSNSSKKFYEQEYFNLRDEVARMQEQRAQFERGAIILVFGIWAWSASQVETQTMLVFSSVVWWVPVFVCWLTVSRITTFRDSIDLCGFYTQLLAAILAHEELPGWSKWLRGSTVDGGAERGISHNAVHLWSFLFVGSVFVALFFTGVALAGHFGALSIAGDVWKFSIELKLLK